MRYDKEKRRPDLDDEHQKQFTQEDERESLEDLQTQDLDNEPGPTKSLATPYGVSSVIKLIRSRTGGSGVTPLD